MGKLSREGYLHYLLSIRGRLMDFLEFVDRGKFDYFEDISLKLRILYLKKSGKAPLLQIIQDKFNFELTVWNFNSLANAMERGDLPNTIPLIMQLHIGPVFWFEEKGKEKLNILDAFEVEKMILIDGYYFSVKDIVEVIADKMGGAHIDPEVKDTDLLPHSNAILIESLNLANRIVYDTTIQTIKAINLVEEFLNKGIENQFIRIKT